MRRSTLNFSNAPRRADGTGREGPPVEKHRADAGRPHVDTLKNSRHGNMKELRFDAADGVWRAAFAFDTARQAIVLVAGDKSGGSEAQCYRRLIAAADKRFDDHLAGPRKGD